MATIEQEYNSGVCAIGSALGTETGKACITQIKKPQAIWLIDPNEKFNKGQTFEAEKARLLKAGKLVVLRGINSFEVSGDDTSETLPDGTQIITTEAKPVCALTFVNGEYFRKALNSLKGFKKWSVILVPRDGTWQAKNTNGDFVGLEMGMFQPGIIGIGSDSETSKNMLSFQLIDTTQLNDDGLVFRQDASQHKQKGVTQINLKLVNAPSDTDTTLTVKAVYAQNGATEFTGVDYTKFLQKIDGATENPTAGDDSATSGTFILTVGALSTGEKGELSLYDNANNQPIIVGVDGDYYRSNTVTYTV